MPQIKPTSVRDLLKFIKEHQQEIINRTYDLVIEEEWIPDLSEDTLKFLLKYCPASHESISKGSVPYWALEILEIHSREQYKHHLRYNVACNPNTPLELLRTLSRDKDYKNVSIRAAVAMNPNISQDLIEALANDPDYNVRERIARNQRTSPVILECLSKDKASDVRSSVASNPNTSPKVLEILAKDMESSVRNSVSSNTQKAKKCFIATAVYGSDMTFQVIVLRSFRDQVLRRYILGKWFIAAYDNVFPPLARFIENKPLIKNIVRRLVLDPLVRFINRIFPI